MKSRKAIANKMIKSKHKTDALCLDLKSENYRNIASCSFDRIVGVKHSSILRLRGEYTIELSCYIYFS